MRGSLAPAGEDTREAPPVTAMADRLEGVHTGGRRLASLHTGGAGRAGPRYTPPPPQSVTLCVPPPHRQPLPRTASHRRGGSSVPKGTRTASRFGYLARASHPPTSARHVRNRRPVRQVVRDPGSPGRAPRSDAAPDERPRARLGRRRRL